MKDYGKAELGINFSKEVKKERKIPFQSPSEKVIVNVGYIYELKGMDYRVK